MSFYSDDADFMYDKREDYIETLNELITDLSERLASNNSDISKTWLVRVLHMAVDLKEELE